MCGIAGAYSLAEAPTADLAAVSVRRMIAALRHRGPDGQGFHDDDQVSLGHARLSIIDVAGGGQPLFNERRDCVLVYNGEVYGYQELRRQLEERHQFSTRSDSEVLLHLYEDLGPEFTTQLNGMYAYAIFDQRTRTLHIGIDPVGIKPLYYFRDPRWFVFASELHSLVHGLRSLGLPISANEQAVADYLRLGWCPAPMTLLNKVHKLSPGERLAVTTHGVHSAVTPLPSSRSLTGDLDGQVEETSATLKRVVTSQLVSDVPVGVLLSGGIDSSLITAVASQLHPGIETFCIGFRSENGLRCRESEAEVAARVARHLGTRHHELTLTPLELAMAVPECLAAMDEPIADPAILPLLQLSRFVRERVTVVLTGDGGDEVFGGYRHHQLRPLRRFMQQLPAGALNTLRAATSLLPRQPSRGWRERLRKLRVGLQLATNAHFHIGPFAGDHATYLGAPDQPLAPNARDHLTDDDRYFVEGLHGPLAGQMLPKTDRITMRAGLEARVPFLDNEMVALGRGLPWSSKVAGGRTKVILRRLLQQYLPSEIVDRPKQGFRVPLGDWFRLELNGWLHAHLDQTRHIPETVISRDNIARLVSLHTAGIEEHSIRLWTLLALETWLASVCQISLDFAPILPAPLAGRAA